MYSLRLFALIFTLSSSLATMEEATAPIAVYKAAWLRYTLLGASVLSFPVRAMLARISRGARLSLPPHTSHQKAYTAKQEECAVTIEKLTEDISKDYFGVDLYNFDYVPLRLRIYNNSDKVYVLKMVKLPFSSGKKVASLLYHNTWSAFQWTVLPPIIFCWPLLGITLPAILYLIYDNRLIQKNMQEKSLGKYDILIRPNKCLDKLIFAHEDFLPFSFDITLEDILEKSLLTFNVKLPT